MLYLTESDVQQLLPMPDCIRLMRSTFEGLRDGTAQNQSRRRLILKTGSVLHSLAGAYGDYFGTKFYSTHPKHGAHFLFALYKAGTAEPLALMEANHLGQIRTGAASGYATDLLANPQASVLGVIGSGYQARTQVEAIRAVRPIREVRVWSRTPEKARRFAEEMGLPPRSRPRRRLEGRILSPPLQTPRIRCWRRSGLRGGLTSMPWAQTALIGGSFRRTWCGRLAGSRSIPWSRPGSKRGT
jgi:hypothetical protein